MKQRNPAMDLIRCFSLLCVISEHFFKHSNFYSYTVTGFPMFIMVTLRCCLMICVPLFLALSGYLQGNKKLSRSYYKGILPVIGVYLLVSLLVIAFDALRDPASFSLKGKLLGILSFTTVNYAWYVEMYLGLFLLIPFLNGMYHSLDSRNKKTCFLLTLLVLAIVPGVLNIWDLTSLSWWKHPASSQNFTLIFPEYWIFLIPLVYYFIGMYLREFPLKLKALPNLLLILLVALLHGGLNYYRSHGATFQVGYWSDYGAMLMTVLMVLVFSFFQNRNYEFMGEKVRKALTYCSGLVFGAYLCSGIVDSFLYPLLDKLLPRLHTRILFLPLIVIVILIPSLLLSAGLNYAYKKIEKLWK